MGDPTVHEQENSQRKPDFLVLNMDALSLPRIKTTSNNKEAMDPFIDSRLHLQNSLSKGAQRTERKTYDGPNHLSDISKEVSLSTTIVPATEKLVTVVSASVQDGPKTATATPQSLQRRRRGPSSPWLHPKKVVLFFATVSSMGTIILLYLTLSRWDWEE